VFVRFLCARTPSYPRACQIDIANSPYRLVEVLDVDLGLHVMFVSFLNARSYFGGGRSISFSFDQRTGMLPSTDTHDGRCGCFCMYFDSCTEHPNRNLCDRPCLLWLLLHACTYFDSCTEPLNRNRCNLPCLI
jgi:hypothetical protein